MAPGGDADTADDRGDRSTIDGTLSELVEVEARIEARVAEAELAAKRRVEEARAQARAVEQDGSRSLEEGIAALRASIEEECAASLRMLRERAEAEVDRYRGVDEATLADLSRWVVARVLEGPESS